MRSSSRYAAHPWIELLRVPEHRDRQFAAKAHCLQRRPTTA